MFTGIIEEVGTVKKIKRGSSSVVLEICAGKVLEETKIGDSIAVNGICLTVVALGNSWFAADVMPESLMRSSLSSLTVGKIVNLERALPANGRFGGHIVSGHVDGVGTILRMKQDDNAVLYTIRSKPSLLRFMVEKGSVAIDGVSLTITSVEREHFTVSLIPHTVAQTCFRERKEGDLVNLETDILGKYVERLLWDSPGCGSDTGALKEIMTGASYFENHRTGVGRTDHLNRGITREFLAEHGF